MLTRHFISSLFLVKVDKGNRYGLLFHITLIYPKAAGISQKWARNSVVECSLCNCISAKSPAFDPPPVQFFFLFYLLFTFFFLYFVLLLRALLRALLRITTWSINCLPINVMQSHKATSKYSVVPRVVEMSTSGKRYFKRIRPAGSFRRSAEVAVGYVLGCASPWFGSWEKLQLERKVDRHLGYDVSGLLFFVRSTKYVLESIM